MEEKKKEERRRKERRGGRVEGRHTSKTFMD
jgi:hypothetical protein